MLLTINPLYRTSLKGFAFGAIALLAACSGDANPVRDTFGAFGAGPKTAPTPDFVRQSRPATLDYVPIGTSAPERPTAAKTADQVKAAEAEMEATRVRNEAAARAAKQAGATPAPAPVRGAGQPAARKKATSP